MQESNQIRFKVASLRFNYGLAAKWPSNGSTTRVVGIFLAQLPRDFVRLRGLSGALISRRRFL